MIELAAKAYIYFAFGIVFATFMLMLFDDIERDLTPGMFRPLSQQEKLARLWAFSLIACLWPFILIIVLVVISLDAVDNFKGTKW